tara:strand:+ start:433 stop:867 length:435 start_codon:yes stop_codon:yes gene_type:complete
MIKILIDNHFEESALINKKNVDLLVKEIFNDYKKSFSSVAFIISNDKKLSQLKKTFFNKDVLTDVITFNLEEKDQPIEGEIYISLERVIDNSKRYKQETFIELYRVLIHGVLHLIGFDDQTSIEKKEMTNLENKYLNMIAATIE